MELLTFKTMDQSINYFYQLYYSNNEYLDMLPKPTDDEFTTNKKNQLIKKCFDRNQKNNLCKQLDPIYKDHGTRTGEIMFMMYHKNISDNCYTTEEYIGTVHKFEVRFI